MRTGRGVQPGVVTVGFHPLHRRPGNEGGDPAQFDRDHLVGPTAVPALAPAPRPAPLDDPLHRLRETLLA